MMSKKPSEKVDPRSERPWCPPWGPSSTGLRSVDRVLGGGVRGRSVYLIGAERGAGLTTLALQVVAGVARSAAAKVLYASGEQALRDVERLADRVGASHNLVFAGRPDSLRVDRVLDGARDARIRVVVLDSVNAAQVEGERGAYRKNADVAVDRAVDWSRETDGAVILLAHYNENGGYPVQAKSLHAVDSLLTLEAWPESTARIFGARGKNRHAEVSACALQMTERGLVAFDGEEG